MTRRAVLDMDVGIDDAIAILYLAAHTDVDIVALGTVHGNGYTDVTTRNALIVLEQAGLGQVPVARGADVPLVVPLSVATFVHGEDGLGNVGMPDPVIPTRQTPWFMKALWVLALLMVVGIGYSFWRISSVDSPTLEVPPAQSTDTASPR